MALEGGLISLQICVGLTAKLVARLFFSIVDLCITD